MTESKTAVVKRPPGRPPTHGGYSGNVLIPITNEKRAEIMDVLYGNDLAIVQSDRVYVDLLARSLAKIEVFDRWLTVNGIIGKDKDGLPIPQPLLKVYWAAVNTAMRACDQLGMTPASRYRLGHDMLVVERDLGARMAQARGHDEDES